MVPAINQNQVYGEPNCMQPLVGWIRSGEQGGTIAKVGTYVLTFLAALIASATLIGAYFVGKAITEYSRQETEGVVLPLQATLAQRDLAITNLQGENANEVAAHGRTRTALTQFQQKLKDLSKMKGDEFKNWKKDVRNAS